MSTIVKRLDYQPPVFLIDEANLIFELQPEATKVTAILKIRRNPEVQSEAPLFLHGEKLKLMHVCIDDSKLTPNDYEVSETGLTIHNVKNHFILKTICEINPASNTELMGLYLSNQIFCTQCEPEAFRRITYFLDRPDVLARFTVSIIADKKLYPMMLSNGNCIEHKDLNHDQLQVTWQDPFLKPSYLFALVAGDLYESQDEFTTKSGRKIALKIYTAKLDKDKTAFAFQALKQAMKWDEDHFGREYDLDIFMIVAIHDFNAGAMENKGLNIFNAKYILAHPDTATDTDYENILSVIGHEYFHNWTGNRVTCRDWFQLSLKEGLTIFRDQSFSRDILGTILVRIDDVRALRASQFSEDAGPLAHPVRPDSYQKIDNFYTMTIYNKGAEVIRMLETILGREGFRRGMDLYFERFDGKAVTIDDFVQALADANGKDFTHFMKWYDQYGTPEVSVKVDYNESKQELNLNFTQQCSTNKNYQPCVIPIKMSFYQGDNFNHHLVILEKAEQQISFPKIDKKPYISFLQNFSAPVKLNYDYTDDELIFLCLHDKDAFNRFEAWNQLLIKYIIKSYQHQDLLPAVVTNIFEQFLTGQPMEWGLQSLLISFPDKNYLAQQIANVDILALEEVYQKLQLQLTKKFEKQLFKIYDDYTDLKSEGYKSFGRRRFIKALFNYFSLLAQDNAQYIELLARHYSIADNMTDRLNALSALTGHDHSKAVEAINHFYQQWHQDPLLLDQWFSVQAAASFPHCIDKIEALLQHPDFNLYQPNRARAVLSVYSRSNPYAFHDSSGKGYQLLSEAIIKIDAKNPHLSSRLVEVFANWAHYAEPYRSRMLDELKRIASEAKLSGNLSELVNKAIG